MQNGHSLDGAVLKEKVAELDARRNTNLALVEPEFARLVDYTGP
jgi:hypothetical protein